MLAGRLVRGALGWIWRGRWRLGGHLLHIWCWWWFRDRSGRTPLAGHGAIRLRSTRFWSLSNVDFSARAIDQAVLDLLSDVWNAKADISEDGSLQFPRATCHQHGARIRAPVLLLSQVRASRVVHSPRDRGYLVRT